VYYVTRTKKCQFYFNAIRSWFVYAAKRDSTRTNFGRLLPPHPTPLGRGRIAVCAGHNAGDPRVGIYHIV